MEASSIEEVTMLEVSEDLNLKLNLAEEERKLEEYDSGSGEEFHEDCEEEEEEHEDCEEEEEEFSFDYAFDGVNTDQISAEEAFDNGQIKPVFPLFNRDLLLLDEGAEDLESLKSNDSVPNVKKVFVAVSSESHDDTSSSTAGNDGEIVGPYCEWSKKAVEVAPEHCKKSNSTGFSKIWRFKELMHRSNSDGRDAFVFLNNTSTSGSTTTATGNSSESEKKEGSSEKKIIIRGERKVNGDGEVVKVKKVPKGKKVALSPHEVYLKSKAKEGRRSYLPYRPELVGFFTSVNGGALSRNVHPF
ncbi:hypothetical protein M9H77_10156 [Catharanthus roseus]|uniref:Uncharacterized protein n=1 Tax=Catharanthus roseus TaxID=4058 RepID=A0ACC0C2U1_CATRO|nr:hypothetical protein M9H77_10156 [Catharanthus roseus]